MDTWMEAETFAKTAYELCMLSRIEEDGGRVARMELLRADDTPVSFSELLNQWETEGRLFKLGRGLYQSPNPCTDAAPDYFHRRIGERIGKGLS